MANDSPDWSGRTVVKGGDIDVLVKDAVIKTTQCVYLGEGISLPFSMAPGDWTPVNVNISQIQLPVAINGIVMIADGGTEPLSSYEVSDIELDIQQHYWSTVKDFGTDFISTPPTGFQPETGGDGTKGHKTLEFNQTYYADFLQVTVTNVSSHTIDTPNLKIKYYALVGARPNSPDNVDRPGVETGELVSYSDHIATASASHTVNKVVDGIVIHATGNLPSASYSPTGYFEATVKFDGTLLTTLRSEYSAIASGISGKTIAHEQIVLPRPIHVTTLLLANIANTQDIETCLFCHKE